MSRVFGQDYANAYDSLYATKDYEAECDLIERIVHEHGHQPVHRILDLGCGTGGHAIPLARRGYCVVGVDRSEEMIEHARAKAMALEDCDRPEYRVASITSLRFGDRFDLAIMMFAVLGYQHDNESVLAALRSMRRHLRSGALAIFDVWYGPVVLGERPADRTREIPQPDGALIRSASSTLDIHRHLCHVSFDLRNVPTDGTTKQTHETHTMRFFFPHELDLFLHIAGFSLIRIGQFPDFDRDPDEATWNVMVLARAV